MSNSFKLCPTLFPEGVKLLPGSLRPPSYEADWDPGV